MTRNRRRAAVAATGSLVLAASLLGAGARVGTAQPARTGVLAVEPPVTLMKTSDVVVANRYGSRAWVDLGVWLSATTQPFEARAVRPSYREQIDAWLVTPGGDVALPDGLVSGFGGLTGFTRVTVTKLDGTPVLQRRRALCPGWEARRVRPDAPDVSTYPRGCNTGHPYTLGAVWGIDAGWAVPLTSEYEGLSLPLAVGRYDVRVAITEPYRDVLGLTWDQGHVTLRLRVQDGGAEHLTTRDESSLREQTGTPLEPAATEPTGPGVVPGPEAQPDLRSLPAFNIRLTKKGYLQFAATVWNAGPSPLVIDGFRRTGEDVMDAYQYFYDHGTGAGYEPVGTMVWHDAPAHHHWHFRDFARYRLLDADKVGVVRSRKESFCLANTDAVDYTVPGANWRPDNTDLHTACGSYSAVGVREVLDSGSGDTYYQSLPGQSFKVAALPNGTYFIAVEANPVGNLTEVSTTNNIAYRKVILKGTGENRRVVVPQLGIIVE